MKQSSKTLDSKIQIPNLFSNMLDRPSLINSIKQQDTKIVLLNAGAGFGKTLLLSQYANLVENQCAWFSLSSLDNDLMQFIQYLIKSIQKVIPEFSFLMEEYLKRDSDKTIVTQIGYDFSMALECVNDPLTIIFDDFQEINNVEIFELLSCLVEHTSSKISLFFAVKGSFPKFLSRYLLSGRILLLTVHQMAFNKDEIKSILKDIPLIEDIEAVAKKIYEVTEGWPAGVMFTVLAIRNMRNKINIQDVDSICMQSTVNDYIMYEIFRKLPYDVQKFLVDTSVFTILSSNLCNKVMEIDNSKSILDYLVRENLFTVKLSGSGNVYQYHSIFRFFLQSQIKKDEKKRILKKTALYCLKSGDIEQAVEYGMMIENAEIVEQAINIIGDSLMNQGQLKNLSRWFSFLLDTNKELNTDTQLLLAKYFRLEKNYPVALEYVEKAIEQYRSSKKEANMVKAVIEKALILRRQGMLEDANALLITTSHYELKNHNLYFLLDFTKLENYILLQNETEALKLMETLLRMELSKVAEKETLQKKRVVERFYELLPAVQERQVEEARLWAELDDIGGVSPIMYDCLLWSTIYAFYQERQMDRIRHLLSRMESTQKAENLFTTLAKILSILIQPADTQKRVEKLSPYLEYAKNVHLVFPKWNTEDEKVIEQILLKERNEKKAEVHYLNIYCLGGFTVKIGNTEVKWRTKKARELFAFLFERQGKISSKEMIIEELWPEIPPGTSSTIFHTTLSYIRKALSQDSIQDVIITKNRGYGLDMSKIKSDFRIFLNICGNIKKHNFALLDGKENILGIYRGRYMEGLEYLWTESTADYLERLYLESCEMLARYEMEKQNYNSAIYCIKAALELDPYVETLQAMLLKCYGEVGNIGHVKQQYEKAKRLMKEELNVEISEQVKEVYLEYVKKDRG